MFISEECTSISLSLYPYRSKWNHTLPVGLSGIDLGVLAEL